MHLFSDFIGCYLSPRPTATTYFSPSTPGSHSRRKKRRTEAVRQLAQNDGGALSHLVQQQSDVFSPMVKSNFCCPFFKPSTTKKARSSFGELHHLASSSGAASGSFVLDTPDKKKGASKTDLVSPPPPIAAAAEGAAAAKTPTSPERGATVAAAAADAAAPSRPLSARQQIFSELVHTEENYVSILRFV